MELTEGEMNKKYGKLCGHCNQNTLLPYEYERTCVSCAFNLIKKGHELTKNSTKKIFMNRLQYAELKIFCICVDVFKTYEGNEYVKIFEALSELKNEKIKMNNLLIEKCNDMLENPDFEQDHYSRTAIGIYKIGQDSNRLLKRLAFYDRSYYVNNNYYDLTGSVLKKLKEIS